MKKTLLPWALLGIGLLVTLFVSFQLKQDVEQDAVRQFAYASDHIAQKIEERLEAYELILHGGAALFVASQQVGRDEWRKYVNSLNLQSNAPGVQGVGFAPLIAADQLAAHTAAIRAEGFPDYVVRPEGRRDVYTPVIYLEPFRDRNLRAFGFDMFSEPVRRAAMERARDTGVAALSGKVELVQETGADVQAGVLLYVPVYRNDMPTQTVAQRRAALVGWVYSAYRMHDLVAGMLQTWQAQFDRDIELSIYDGPAPTPASLLYSVTGPVRDARTLFYQQRTLDFNGHRWLLAFDRSATLPSVGYAPAWLALAGGLAISGLLFWLARALINTRFNANQIAEGLTFDIRQREQQLKDTEFRWKFALEGSDLGVWDWNLADNSVFFSKVWKEMLGFAEDEIGTGVDEWDRRVHPDDKADTVARVQACLDGVTPHYESEHRVLCKDGSYKWIRDRGMVILRSEDGKPLRMIGTHSDISTHKQDVLRIRHLARLYAALSECNAAIVRCTSQEELFERICRIVVEFGGMKMAWIGLTDEASGKISPVNSHGDGTDYLDNIEISVRADDPHGQGATGTAVRDNAPVWIEDFRQDPRTVPWRQRAAQFGWISSAALPICRDGKPVGALTFYSAEVGWFDQEKRHLLEDMAAQISFALDKLDAEIQTRRYQATLVESEQRFRTLVEQSIAGVYIIQDGKISYVNPRFERIFGYEPGEGMVGMTPQELVIDKDRMAVDQYLGRLLAGDGPSVEFMFTARRKDGTSVDVGTTSALATYQQRPAIIGLIQDISDKLVAEGQLKRYAEKLHETFLQTVGVATTLVEMRDPYTAGHEKRVAEIAVAIGAEMGLDNDQLEGLRVGGYLHDVGKIVVPTEILSKPGRLTAIEFELIKEHAKAGYGVLKDVDFPWPVALIAYQHHERIDGSGYPQGLKGEDIILEARIVAVADVIESMATHRPYRAALGIDKALAEVARGSGSVYDPLVVSACLRLFREKGYVLQS